MRPDAALIAVCCCLGASGHRSLPATLAEYRSWHTLRAEPALVPASLAALCIPISKAKFEEIHAAEAKTYGPHTGRYVQVYVNPSALRALSDAGSTGFPIGAVIAKEKLLAPRDRRWVEVAFMIKREAGQFTESGGWEFRYHPIRPDARYTACIECHRAGGSKDFVFSRLKR